MSIRSHVPYTVFYALAAAMSLIVAPSAEAETVHCDAGDVQCLIAAINQANADPRKTTIRLAGGTYALTNVDNDTHGPNGLPSIVSTVTITGGHDGAVLTRMAGSPGFRILHVGASGNLTLQRVTIGPNPFDASDTGGASGLFNDGGVVTVIDSSFIDNILGDVGALYNDHGTLKVVDSAFIGNFGSGSAGVASAGGLVDIVRTVFETNDGIGAGGVLSVDSDVRITASRFSGNHGHEGAVVRVSGGTAAIVQTTFDGNVADPSIILVEDQATLTVRDSAFVANASFGAAILNFSATINVINTTFARNGGGFVGGLGIMVTNFGTMTILNSTFADHQSTRPHFGAVIYSSSGATTLLQNTAVAHTVDLLDCLGDITSLGNNLIGDPSGCNISLQLGDLTGDAGLGELTDDGTPGNAHYQLLPESQVIDAANDAACPKKDQIGRPRTARCDIGAIEFRRSDAVTTTQ